jgi:hypothetical protein
MQQLFTSGSYKGQTMNDNHKDIVAAIILGLSLCAGLLAYFDILVK